MMQMMIPEWPERCMAWHRIPPEVWALSPHCFRLVDGPTPRQAAPCRAPPRTSATPPASLTHWLVDYYGRCAGNPSGLAPRSTAMSPIATANLHRQSPPRRPARSRCTLSLPLSTSASPSHRPIASDDPASASARLMPWPLCLPVTARWARRLRVILCWGALQSKASRHYLMLDLSAPF